MYASDKQDAKYWLDLIKSNPHSNPVEIKEHFYNGTGTPILSDYIMKPQENHTLK